LTLFFASELNFGGRWNLLSLFFYPEFDVRKTLTGQNNVSEIHLVQNAFIIYLTIILVNAIILHDFADRSLPAYFDDGL